MRVKLLVFVTLCLVAVMVVVPGAGVEAQQAPGPPAVERTEGGVVGASVAHPAKWTVEREEFTFDDTYGFTLWRPDTAEAHDHGGTPALRVALAYDLEPGQIEAQVRETLAYYDRLPVERQTVSVAEKGYRGVAVGPIPGSTPSTEVYVPVNGRVYRINVYAEEPGEEGLGAGDRRLLSGVRFESPSRAVRSLELPKANSPEALYPSGEDARAVALRDDGKTPPDAAEAPLGSEALGPESLRSATPRAGGEARIAEGCWRADPTFYVQTQHGYGANSAAGDGPGGANIPTGWSMIGYPNYWGQYTHGNLGYGRCVEPYYANDKFAVDYPLNRYDYVFSPFNCGRVTYAGRNQTHADYGIFVSIRGCNGKYVNLTAHLQALRNGLSKGDRVTRDTVIGYAGDTGGGTISVGPVHIHQAFYRYPRENPDGSPYGGAGLQVVRHRYVGTAASRAGITVSSHLYSYATPRPNYRAYCREGIVCGEGYKISN